MEEFETLGLSDELLRAVKAEGYTTPTPVQALSIPPLLEGRDVLGVAQTGTGKTAAFALPVLQAMSRSRPQGKRFIRALVLSPTRELAAQIDERFSVYSEHLDIRHKVIFGGVKQNPQVRALEKGLDILVVQDIFMTATAQLADVVLPSSVGWAECDGTVTSSERRVQRVRAAVTPPGACRHDHEIIGELAKRMGVESWGDPTPQELWDELRSLSPLHAGMSYERLEAEGGLQWPCPSEDHPGSPFLHGWLAHSSTSEQPGPS